MINSKINEESLEEENIEEMNEVLSEQEETIQAPKKKKVLNENQRKAVAINLAKGRANLKIKQEQQRLHREERKEELKKVKEETILKKANQIKQNHNSKIEKTKTKINQIIKDPDFGINSNEIYDEEETVITKKPKKKRIIYREESDSEEEVVVKKMPKQKPIVKPPLLQFF